MGFAPGGVQGFLTGLPGEQTTVGGVQRTDQGGQRRAHVVGKAGHQLPVGFLGGLQGGQAALVVLHDVVDLIDQRGGRFPGAGQNTAAAVARTDIGHSALDLGQLLAGAVQSGAGGQGCRCGGESEYERHKFHLRYTSRLKR